jgi:hypothetical protein
MKHWVTYQAEAHQTRLPGPRRPSRPRLARRCKCGGNLQWESSTTAFGQHWLALCASPVCGEITVKMEGDVDDDAALQVFLLGHREAQADAPPWMRTFLRSAAIPGTGGWKPTRQECWECDEPAVMRLSMLPLSDPYQAMMCLRCGALSTFHRTPTHEFSQLLGKDWAEPDPCISRFIRGVRALAELAWDSPPDWHSP